MHNIIIICANKINLRPISAANWYTSSNFWSTASIYIPSSLKSPIKKSSAVVSAYGGY